MRNAKRDTEKLVFSIYTQLDSGLVKLGGTLIGLNIILMALVSMYWLNPEFHKYISGNPL